MPGQIERFKKEESTRQGKSKFPLLDVFLFNFFMLRLPFPDFHGREKPARRQFALVMRFSMPQAGKSEWLGRLGYVRRPPK